MEIILTIILTLVLAPAIVLFFDGFMFPKKVEDPGKNRAMTSLLFLTGRPYFAVNRFGAWLRRLLSGLRRA